MEATKTDVTPDKELDLSGLLCPVPIALTSETVKKMEEGQILKVISTDPGFEKDIWNWSRQTGNELVRVEKENGKTIAYIRKTSGSSEPSLWYWIKFHALGVKLHLKMFLIELNPFLKKPDHFITFVAISEGTRAERFIKGKFKAVLLPVPDEIDPHCGVVLAVRGEKEAKELYETLQKEGFGVEALYKREGKNYKRIYP